MDKGSSFASVRTQEEKRKIHTMGRRSQASRSHASWARASREPHGLPSPRQSTASWGACTPRARSASSRRPGENPGYGEVITVREAAWTWEGQNRPNLDTRGSILRRGAPVWCALMPRDGRAALGHCLVCFCVFCAGAQAQRAVRTPRRSYQAWVCSGCQIHREKRALRSVQVTSEYGEDARREDAIWQERDASK